MEQVRTVYFDMPAYEADAIAEALNQHLEDKGSPDDYDVDDLIRPVFEFRDKLNRILNKPVTGSHLPPRPKK